MSLLESSDLQLPDWFPSPEQVGSSGKSGASSLSLLFISEPWGFSSQIGGFVQLPLVLWICSPALETLGAPVGPCEPLKALLSDPSASVPIPCYLYTHFPHLSMPAFWSHWDNHRKPYQKKIVWTRNDQRTRWSVKWLLFPQILWILSLILSHLLIAFFFKMVRFLTFHFLCWSIAD